MGKVQYSRKAIKGLRKLPANVADQFRTAFQEIANSRGHWEVKKLAGREGYRLRIGGYRGIYKIEGEQVTVLVLAVGPPGGIYK
ncbi:cytotoxic translational repressor of toxin-antitoxin stability system [Methylophaga frappieri]|uniref:Cytotoxic translational repressor of toxin-antitoxin stability system n=1 Tax=Methylophaga frappieri (strain ATCC BAA-2434 / DSM 25690 / JAM7) TaxID=754477 RepID=I1YIJ1_METFJ|nr:cytotoxic translational repressor of toxin-antitoxin stability system [Methylophaga frappieri]|tara:strand:- start:112 stop:363 length:252 start_codon:yes stop_codon:yes gene_type:complete